MGQLGRFLSVALLLLLLPAAPASADLVVVVNAKTGVEKLTRDEVINIFLGRFRQFSSGLSARPVDLPASQPERALFYRLLVNKEPAEINAYWSRLTFAGRTVPPRAASSLEDMLDYVSTTPGAIGYLERTRLDGRIRVVLDLSPKPTSGD